MGVDKARDAWEIYTSMRKCPENYSACPYFNAADIEGHLATHLGRTNISGLLGNIGIALELAARECLF